MFGASNASSSNPPSSGLFGGPKPQNSSSNLFGSSTASSGSLFGSTNTSTPQTGTSLFGSSTPASSSAQPGLFGASNTPAPTQNPSSNLFGTSNQNSTSSSPFGLSTNTNLNPSGTPSLFGSSQVNSTNLGTSFGTKSSSVPVTPASSSVVSNVASQSAPVFTRTTRFNDLPDDAKKQLEALDAMIQTQCRHSDALKAMELGTEITEGTSLLRQVTSEMHATSASVTTSSNLLDSIRQAIDADVTDLLKLAAIVEAYHSQRLNVGSSHNPSDSTPNPIKFQFEFFFQKTTEMEDRLKRYRQTIDFVELQLKGLFDRPSPASILPALKAQYSTFMVLADKVAQLNTAVVTLKEDYRELWRHQTGSVRDPFAEIDRAFEIGAPTINFQAC